jgi:hypothetical protein
MNTTITVINKANGDTAFTIPVEGFENVHMVTLQKDGEIRWASVGPLTPEQTSLFYDALRLALSFAFRNTSTWHNNLAGGVTYQNQ